MKSTCFFCGHVEEAYAELPWGEELTCPKCFKKYNPRPWAERKDPKLKEAKLIDKEIKADEEFLTYLGLDLTSKTYREDYKTLKQDLMQDEKDSSELGTDSVVKLERNHMQVMKAIKEEYSKPYKRGPKVSDKDHYHKLSQFVCGRFGEINKGMMCPYCGSTGGGTNKKDEKGRLFCHSCLEFYTEEQSKITRKGVKEANRIREREEPKTMIDLYGQVFAVFLIVCFLSPLWFIIDEFNRGRGPFRIVWEYFGWLR